MRKKREGVFFLYIMNVIFKDKIKGPERCSCVNDVFWCVL